MAFKVRINIRAQAELESAYDWYMKKSPNAGNRFLDSLESAKRVLKVNPYYQIRYRNIRSISLRQFPYSLYFIVEEEQNTVRVLSCFH
jgi:plasmid stabilization system protein ParE